MHSKLAIITLALSALSVAPACDAPAPQSPNDAENLDGRGAEDHETFYIVTRRDVRKCAFPLCGGFFVQRVNQDTTRCADGSTQPECYVAEIDLSALRLPAAGEDSLRGALAQRGALVRGTIAPGRDPNFAGAGTLVASEGWLGRAGKAPTGTFYRLLGVAAKCSGLPCPSAHAFRLNTGWDAMLAGVDLAASGAPEEARGEADRTMFESTGGLLVAGTLTTVSGPNGSMESLVASEFYTPAVAASDGPRACAGIAGAACGAGELCDLEPGQCKTADAGGMCMPKPEACIEIFQPVCGCDGVTYANDCKRMAAGAAKDHDGECT